MSVRPRGRRLGITAVRATAAAAIVIAVLGLLAVAGGTGFLSALRTVSQHQQAASDDVPAIAAAGTVGAWRLGILAGGDMLFDLAPGAILATEGAESVLSGWSALRWRDHIQLGLANLECPLTVRGEALPGKKYTFRADPATVAPALAELGFDAVSLANNHVLDYGQVGLLDTLDALAAVGVAPLGAGLDRTEAYAPVLLERSGVCIALLAFGSTDYMPATYQAWWAAGAQHPGIAPIEPRSALLAAVAQASTGADVVIVSMHWGLEYHQVTAQQQQLGRAIIEAGADIVVGHHPHVPQPVEFWRGRPIIYSLGNLVFHAGQPRARQMAVAEVIVSGGGENQTAGKSSTFEVRLHGLVNDGGRSEAMPETEAVEFLSRLAESCRQLGTPAALDGTVLVLTQP